MSISAPDRAPMIIAQEPRKPLSVNNFGQNNLRAEGAKMIIERD
jgi:hypothetical protein